MYSKEVAEHIAHPRNIGEIESPSGVGDVTNEVCLDRIRLTIRVVENEIVDARVKTQGCPPTIAAASALTELIIGRSVEGAASLSKNDIVKALGHLPAAKAHCAILAIDALRSALEERGKGEKG